MLSAHAKTTGSIYTYRPQEREQTQDKRRQETRPREDTEEAYLTRRWRNMHDILTTCMHITYVHTSIYDAIGTGGEDRIDPHRPEEEETQDKTLQEATHRDHRRITFPGAGL